MGEGVVPGIPKNYTGGRSANMRILDLFRRSGGDLLRRSRS
jgi:hypothetical protein